MLTTADSEALLLTIRLALVTTAILLALSIPASFGLMKLYHRGWGQGAAPRASSARRWYRVLRTVFALPLVLPPTVLGFYLIVLLSPTGLLVSQLGLPAILFSFPGLVVGSVIYSLPLTIAPITDGFIAIPERYMTAAAQLQLSWTRTLATIALPLARKGVITGAALGFAHTLGEFGVVLMIGGNIPGQTRLLSMAIYDHVEALDFASAHRLALIALALAFCLLIIVQGLGRSHHDR